MKSGIQHVCFDKDGTLIDVHQSWVPITERRTLKIRQFYGLGEDSHHPLALAMGVDLNRKRIIPGGPVGYKARPIIIDATAQWLQSRHVPAKADELTGIFAEVDRDVQAAQDFHAVALPGVVDGIKRLKKAGFKVSVYTSDRSKNADLVLKLIGLDGYIDAIVGGDQVQRPKPDAEGFIKACDAVGISPDLSVYVGDSVDDMRTVKGRTYGLTHGIATKEELAPEASKVFNSFKDLTEFLLTS